MNAPTPAPPQCSASGCAQDAVLQWQRYANRAEHAQMMASQLQPIDGIVRVSVFGCEAHAFAGDAATITHRDCCEWPSTCRCDAADEPPDYMTGTEVTP